MISIYNPHISCGLNNISAVDIPVAVPKTCSPALIPVLFKLCNICITSCFPDCWISSFVVHVLKNCGPSSNFCFFTQTTDVSKGSSFR